jgi:asparagine synthase (glutamine-hydrolysing)
MDGEAERRRLAAGRVALPAIIFEDDAIVRCAEFSDFAEAATHAGRLALGRRGTKLLAHRGPDGAGEWFDPERGLFLGHRRLAIIDVDARSDQPMVRGRNVVVHNGEVYNFSELRDELRSAGEEFVTSGDTEVLLAAWARWGEGALDRFDAMFAFALVDDESLVLATDPFGEKPLYIAETGDGIWFASEPQPLIDILQLKFKPDHDDIGLFLSLGFLPPPRTGFAGLEVMQPATLRRYRPDLRHSERRYWYPPQIPMPMVRLRFSASVKSTTSHRLSSSRYGGDCDRMFRSGSFCRPESIRRWWQRYARANCTRR